MESWQASVDRRLGQTDGDIRSLLRYGVAAVVALALAIGGLYIYIGAQINPIEGRLSTVESTVARIDERTAAIQKQQDKMDGKLDQLIARK